MRIKPAGWFLVLVFLGLAAFGAVTFFAPELPGQLLGQNQPEVPTSVSLVAPAANADAVVPTRSSLPAQPAAPQPTVAPAERVTLTIALDAFGSYFTAIHAASLATQYNASFVPFYFEDANAFSEAERAAKLSSGEWDVLLTTADFLPRVGNVGTIAAIVDQSAGADKIVAWPHLVTITGSRSITVTKFNDLKNATIAFSQGSVGHYQVLALLRLVGLSTDQVKLMPTESVEEAVQAFLDKKADAVAAWEPNVLDAMGAGGTVLVSSDWWRNIADVIVISKQADQAKHDAVQAFVHDWFLSLKIQQESLPQAADAIAAWKYQGKTTGDWTFVYPETATDDFSVWLAPVAQASLGANLILGENVDFFVEQLTDARKVWEWSKIELPAFDPMAAIDMSYVQALANDGSLVPNSGALVNPSFQPIPLSIEKAGLEKLVDLPSFAELPCQKFEYNAESTQLTAQSIANLKACAEPLDQLLKLSDTYILVTGSAAWPGSGSYQETHIRRFARQRAIGLEEALVTHLSISPDRIEVQAVIPPQQDQNSNDESVNEKYRYVLVELKRAGR